MLNTNELRVGNWLNHDGYGNIKVHAINSETDEILPTFEVYGQGDWWGLENFEPIAIAPEVLAKFGAEPFGNGDLSLKNNLIHYAECRGVYIHSATSVELKTVHQLQNLFFALMGIELEVAW